MTYLSKLYRIGEIASMYYSMEVEADVAVIYGIGAPIPPDNGYLSDASLIVKCGVDLFVPDYLGYGRSDGVFTPENCLKTLLNLFDNLTKGCTGNNYYSLSTKRFKYKSIIFVGRSLGGAYVPLLPKYNREINKLGLLFPAVNQAAQGSVKGEETNEDFMRSIKKDGYHYLYRNMPDEVWWEHLENKDGLSPMDNIKYLSGCKLFIGHGMKDKCIHYSKSKQYYKKILDYFPDNKDQYKLKLYSEGAHDTSTTKLAVNDFMKWILKPK